MISRSEHGMGYFLVFLIFNAAVSVYNLRMVVNKQIRRSRPTFWISENFESFINEFNIRILLTSCF
jgi:hypothetical protein